MSTEQNKVCVDKIKDQIGALVSELRESSLEIDAFMKKKLSESREGGEKCAEEALRVLTEIDANYNDLIEAKAKNVDRHDWLLERIERMIHDEGADNKRELMGEVFAHINDVLKGNRPHTTEVKPFSGLDAGEIIEAIEDELHARSIKSVM